MDESTGSGRAPAQSAAELLALADDAAANMVRTSAAPRGLLVLLGAWVATLLSLRHVAPPGLLIVLASLLLPLALWCLLHYRRRPRPRRLVENDGAYAGYFLFGLLALAVLQFWEALGPIAITAKWLSVFAVFWFCQQRMRRALALARQKDAHEHAH